MSNEETIFSEALAHGSEQDRAAYLDRACAGDPELRREVEALLKAHQNPDGALESPPPGLGMTEVENFSAERIGSSVGPYKLLEQIGGGGMGVVYMAEQIRPVRRKVALKIIKPGMDSRQVIARFEAERQALTMMDHPNIAKVLDAGTTDSGRPYFVMELVKGIPITDYCDQAKLNTRQRLELFIGVCHAVQHAHQKGVIHRDIKPGNVLVTLHDDKPVPKVIDFGIAKATSYQLTEKTLFTNFAQMMGTPLYMSPEQAQLSGLDVDTRSDVYSLGVLLYELLTGTTPFDKKRLVEAAYDEMRRIIREEEPPKPSTRLSTMGEKLTGISAHRQSDPKRLGQLMRGELDWIVMKSLEKDRTHRYETPSAFAADVLRHLGDLPVEACPPSVIYRVRKFVSRNKRSLAIAVSFGIVLFVLIGIVAASLGTISRDRTIRRARLGGQVDIILEEAARWEHEQNWDQAFGAAKRAQAAIAVGEATPEVVERVGVVLADLQLVRRLEDIRARAGSIWGKDRYASTPFQGNEEYSAAFREAGIDLDALPAREAARRLIARKPIATALVAAVDDWLAVRIDVNDDASSRRLTETLQLADPDPWRQQLRDVLLRKDWQALEKLATSEDLSRQTLSTFSILCFALRANAKYSAEIDVLRQAQWKYPDDFWITRLLGTNLNDSQTPDAAREAIGFLRAAVALRPRDSNAMLNLGQCFLVLGDDNQALAHFQKAAQLNPDDVNAFSNRIGIYIRRGLYADAMATYETLIKLRPQRPVYYLRFAEFLVECPDPRVRNADRALELVGQAFQLGANMGIHWTYKGIVYYRRSEYQQARIAFEQAVKSDVFDTLSKYHRDENQAECWFYLAMSQWQLGQKDEARQSYQRGMVFAEKGNPAHKGYILIQREANTLLGIDAGSSVPAPGPVTPAPLPSNEPIRPVTSAPSPRLTTKPVH